MFSNPITSIFGLIAVLCPIVSHFFPDIKAVCDNITTEAIGLGLISAADGVKRPALAAIKPMLLAVGIGLTISGMFSACTELKKLLPAVSEGVQSIVADKGAGVYEVTVTKDGKTLWVETLECYTEGDQLAGCKRITPLP